MRRGAWLLASYAQLGTWRFATCAASCLSAGGACDAIICTHFPRDSPVDCFVDVVLWHGRPIVAEKSTFVSFARRPSGVRWPFGSVFQDFCLVFAPQDAVGGSFSPLQRSNRGIVEAHKTQKSIFLPLLRDHVRKIRAIRASRRILVPALTLEGLERRCSERVSPIIGVYVNSAPLSF